VTFDMLAQIKHLKNVSITEEKAGEEPWFWPVTSCSVVTERARNESGMER